MLKLFQEEMWIDTYVTEIQIKKYKSHEYKSKC